MTKKKRMTFAVCAVVILVVVCGLLFWYLEGRGKNQVQIVESPQSMSPAPTQSPEIAPVSPSSKVSPKPSVSPLPVGGIGAVHRDILGTVFWVGETAGPDNGHITNEVSAWDTNWMANYGGYDDPNSRNGYFPASFTPKQNPFYFALPYTDFAEYKVRKESAKKIPWYSDSIGEKQTLLKNRWIAIGSGNKVCYGQWQDIGPGEYDDFDYVFGNARPKNSFTGIDISPALRDCLGTGGRPTIWWQFVGEGSVPAGPWRDIITSS